MSNTSADSSAQNSLTKPSKTRVKRKWTFDAVVQLFKTRNFTILETKRQASKVAYRYKCSCGNITCKLSVSNFLQGKDSCRDCSNKKRITKKNVQTDKAPSRLEKVNQLKESFQALIECQELNPLNNPDEKRDEDQNESSTSEIPMRNQHGEVVNAICSTEDLEELSKWPWSLSHGYAVCSSLPSGYARMHQFVMKLQGIVVPEDKEIDHKNTIRLDNRRQNLRIATGSLNKQNQLKRKGTTSQYKGVHLVNDKWVAKYAHKYLGTFNDEISAAYSYDCEVIAVHGKDALINKVAKPKEETRCYKNLVNNLPLGVYPTGNKGEKKWSARVFKDKKLKKLGSFKTIEAASSAVAKYKAQAADTKEKLHQSQTIERSAEGVAIIKTSKGEIILVDDDDWLELTRYSWSLSEDGYASAHIPKHKNNLMMHLFLLPLDGAERVDHISGQRFDNRKANLRRVTAAINTYNRRKRPNSSSHYFSVFKSGNKFMVQIQKDFVGIYFGIYDSELVAASRQGAPFG